MKKILLSVLMLIGLLLTTVACGSRLEGTYQCIDPSVRDRYIRFSDGKIYKTLDGDFNGATGWPYKIEGEYIQETSIGVRETEFSLKGDRLTYGELEYVNVDSNEIDDAVEESWKLLEDFDGKYKYGSTLVLEIDSKNNSMKIYFENNSSDPIYEAGAGDLFYLKADGNIISGALGISPLSIKTVEDSLLFLSGSYASVEFRGEFIREGCRSIYYGVYKTEYEYLSGSETVTVVEYLGIDENGLFYVWDEGANFIRGPHGKFVAENLSFFSPSDVSDWYQPDSAMETITLNAGETNFMGESDEKVYTRVEGVTIPKQ